METLMVGQTERAPVDTEHINLQLRCSLICIEVNIYIFI